MKVGLTGRIAASSARRPWLTLGAWVAVLAGAIAATGSLDSALTQEERMLTPVDSQVADDIDRELRGSSDAVGTETVIVKAAEARFGDPDFTAVLDRVAGELGRLPGVTAVSIPTVESPFPVSTTGDAALVTLTVAADPDADEAADSDVYAGLVEAAGTFEAEGFTVLLFGEGSGEVLFDTLAEESLVRGEMIGIGVAIVILLFVFGALVAAGIPLAVALVSIATAMGATALVGQIFDLSFFVVNMITMMGLALGIDYTLIMVQRFREELARGRDTMDAVTVAGNTANRAVFFSGLTVLIALVGLLLVPSTIMRSLGAGAMIVAVTSVAAALTLLPAVLRLLGARVNKGRIPTAHPGGEPRRWAALARAVVSRPAVGAVVGGGLLVALALPMLSMRLTFPGFDSLPEDNSLRQSTEILTQDFGWGRSGTTIVVQDALGAEGAVAALAAAVEADPAYAETEVETVGSTAFIDTKDVYDSADIRAEQALERLRDDVVPNALDGTGLTALVGGDQASSVDFTRLILDSAPLVLLIVLGSSFLLLMFAFRSVVIPAMSIAVNLLSAAAAYGLMVAVFQYGWGSDLLGMPQVDGIAPWIPLFLFAVLFGLSMDYHVFLLSRVKEHHDAHGDNQAAIIHGLSRTGSLITGAALIMVAVFSGFALGDLPEFAQMGFGLGAAIILDATVVRTLLVPSLMALLGSANWYLPRWLQWLPQMRIEGGEERPARRPEPEKAVVLA